MKQQQYKKFVFSLISLIFYLFSFTTSSQANIPTRHTLVNLTLSANDTGSGMGSGSLMRFSNDAVTWSPDEDYATNKQNWDLTSYGGNNCTDSHTVYVQFADAAGNWTTQTIGATITLELPTVAVSPPGGVYSSQQVVTLTAFETDTIYYSTDGATFMIYSGPVLIDRDTDLSYYAMDTCGNFGEVLTETYTIEPLDSDGDGVADSDDNCPDIVNTDQADADADGYGDVCDSCTDTDGDGYGTPGYSSQTCAFDNCPDIVNIDQADCDGDGIGDACDTLSPCSTDSDGDGVVDSDDNCPDIVNTDQVDCDEDGIGDACDPDNSCFMIITEEFGDAISTDYPGTCQDAFINSGSADTNTSSEPNLNTYTWPVDVSANRIIIKWDLSAVPDSAIIESAVLYLYSNGIYGSGGDENYEISAHKIISNNPDINNCTWNTYDGINSWTGGPDGAEQDMDIAEDTQIIDKTIGEYKSWTITNMVADWVANPSENFGMILDSDNQAASDSNRYFASSDHADNSVRPKLIVNYIIDSAGDFDGDGIIDDDDNCPDIVNIDQVDCDGDGIGDACDTASPCSTDSDGDMIMDSDDNCPDIPNIDQSDIDEDGIGDLCDDSESGLLHVGPGQTYTTIQEAIDVSLDGEKVLVYDGTYYENIDFMGKSIAVISVNGPTTTIIDGTNSDSVVIFNNVDHNTILDGFTITGGFAAHGGGIYCQQSSPTISNCIISRNSSSTYGGGIYSYQSSPTIIDCTINENLSSFYGGGVYTQYSDIRIINCTIYENTTDFYGAGVYSKEASVIITNCLIAGNMTLVSQKGKGGGIYLWDSPSMIMNCTITGNMATHYGGAVYYGGLFSQKDIINSILWGNTVEGVSNEIYNIGEDPVTVTYSNIEGGFPGVGNINSDPLFVNPETVDYRLQPGSPCIDSANSDDPAPSADIYNNLRYDDPLTPNTGSGINGSYYDMGAYEYHATSN